jgi:hypothetical protein
VPYASQHDDKWISELRRVSVVFVNLGVNESELVKIDSEDDVVRVNEMLVAVQVGSIACLSLLAFTTIQLS